MTQDEIIRMAREVGAIKRYWGNSKEGFAFENDDQLERFAALVAAHEREQLHNNPIHIIRQAEERGELREREACAKVCEDIEFHVDDKCYAAAIRARGSQ